ncbi:MAG: oligoendopeptidase F, partial [Chthoniobacterales bacterium]
MTETATPTRAEISEADKWDLTHLFADVDKWQEDFAWLQRTFPKILEWKGRVGESAESLAAILEFDKSLDLKIERVSHFASLQLAEDSANPEYLARMGQLQNLLTKISEAAAFITPEIQAIPDEKFAAYLQDHSLGEWTTRLRRIRRFKPHVLSEAEERLLAMGSAALDGYDDTFSQLTDVDMKFGVLIDADGKERPLTQSSFGAFLVKRDHTLRERAFHQFYDEFQDHQFT